MTTVKIGNYEIREPLVGDVPDLFDMMAGGEHANMKNIINDLLVNCVFLGGQRLGDRIKDVPLRDLRPMITELVKMAGLEEKK